jgi:hypothetical protein
MHRCAGHELAHQRVNQQQQQQPSLLVLSFGWQRDSGSPRLATAHCSVPQYFREALYNSYLLILLSTLLHHSTP